VPVATRAPPVGPALEGGNLCVCAFLEDSVCVSRFVAYQSLKSVPSSLADLEALRGEAACFTLIRAADGHSKDT
jgi:hypothetical protein